MRSERPSVTEPDEDDLPPRVRLVAQLVADAIVEAQRRGEDAVSPIGDIPKTEREVDGGVSTERASAV